MIELNSFSLSYGSEDSQIFRRLNLEFQSAELSVICGPTGSGKSTLLKSLIGLVPSFNFAHTSGQIFLDGIEISGKRPQELASLIGFVNQRPEAAFVTESVIEEIAFGMEQLGFPAAEMKHRVQQISNQLDIQHLLDSKIEQLSAGQQQRVAIAAALAAGQKLLLLDEPSAALDAKSTTNLWKLLRDLADNHGVTVLVAEHRLAEVIDFADSVTLLKGDGSAQKVNPNWESVLRVFPDWEQKIEKNKSPSNSSGFPLLRVTDLEVSYPGSIKPALKDISFAISQGEIVSLFGPNGSGKTTLLMAIAGVLKANRGKISLSERDVSELKRKERSAALAVIPQRASDLLFLGSVGKELAESDAYAAAPPNTTSSIFESLIGRVNPSIHPRDLSTGQQLALVIALQLSVGAELVLLDEPTRGLDYEAKVALAAQLGILASQGKSILIATHDEAFAQSVSDRTELIDAGHLRKMGK